jgi:hypothetical protein
VPTVRRKNVKRSCVRLKRKMRAAKKSVKDVSMTSPQHHLLQLRAAARSPHRHPQLRVRTRQMLRSMMCNKRKQSRRGQIMTWLRRLFASSRKLKKLRQGAWSMYTSIYPLSLY